MPAAEHAADLAAIDLARECLYRFLAVALTDPAADAWPLLLDADSQRLAAEAAGLLRDEAAAAPAALGFGELPPDGLDLAPLLAESRRPRAELTAEYDRVFGLVPSPECLPYETEYHATAEPFFRAQQLADVAGFYRAFGLEPSRGWPERPDHLALELEFLALLLAKKRLASAGAEDDNEAAARARVCAEAEDAFFRDHLAWWVPSFATGLRRKAGQGFYAALGQALAALMPAERARFGVAPPRVPLQAVLIERPEEQAGCAGC
ncbi:MAG TPA: molecular chaperone TorD family protein [Gemmataceae bacterium]|nr:molecular chaperone TorD family protein [Gemmataceae bacterium]